jgi:hypothetical protein
MWMLQSSQRFPWSYHSSSFTSFKIITWSFQGYCFKLCFEQLSFQRLWVNVCCMVLSSPRKHMQCPMRLGISICWCRRIGRYVMMGNQSNPLHAGSLLQTTRRAMLWRWRLTASAIIGRFKVQNRSELYAFLYHLTFGALKFNASGEVRKSLVLLGNCTWFGRPIPLTLGVLKSQDPWISNICSRSPGYNEISNCHLCMFISLHCSFP